jgi:hypothetical protein
MDAQRRAASGKPSLASTTKKRGLGSEAPGSSARGSEDRSSVAPPPPPRGTKRAREIEGIDKVCFLAFFCASKSRVVAFLQSAQPRCDRKPSPCLVTHFSVTWYFEETHAMSSYINSTLRSIDD